MNKYQLMNTLFSAIGGAIIGGAVAVYATKKHYQDFAEFEIGKIRHHYALIRKDQNAVGIFGEMPSENTEQTDTAPDDGVTRAETDRMIQELGYRSPENSVKTHSIFEEAVDPSAVGDEISGPGVTSPKKLIVTESSPKEPESDPMSGYKRLSGQPYIISQMEMFDSNLEWEKPTLSYYVDDDTLIDERETPIVDVEYYIGSRHLDMFGVLSGDENIVYVRNPNMSVDFEVIREPGKYTVRVLGEPDYEYAEKQKLRRMRDRD